MTSFRARTGKALAAPSLQEALTRARTGFVPRRLSAVAAVEDDEPPRARGPAVREHTLDHQDHYLERYAAAGKENGGQVHWARDAAEARQVEPGLCRAAGAGRVVEGKSMVTEEVGLNGPWSPSWRPGTSRPCHGR